MILEGEKKARVHPLRSKNYIAPKAIPHNGNPRTGERRASKAQNGAHFQRSEKWTIFTDRTKDEVNAKSKKGRTASVHL